MSSKISAKQEIRFQAVCLTIAYVDLVLKGFWCVFFLRDYLQAPNNGQKETRSLFLLLLKLHKIHTKRHQRWPWKTSSKKTIRTSKKLNKTPLSRSERNIKNNITKGILKILIKDKAASKKTRCRMVGSQPIYFCNVPDLTPTHGVQKRSQYFYFYHAPCIILPHNLRN